MSIIFFLFSELSDIFFCDKADIHYLHSLNLLAFENILGELNAYPSYREFLTQFCYKESRIINLNK